eukprot:TRINITY_DN65597_c0_g1_i1.p1 TRINITY_DN65597_c0_g1~~TRINITY_DN65597_c0_g1_i1.p1  ORF type:complete len:500 (+),score=88.64 TRINITY_DN65597_c0_g1_i1:41-1540(+)
MCLRWLACISATWLAVARAMENALETESTCGARDGQGKCGYDDGRGTYQSKETGRGAGTSKVPMCGGWCSSEADSNTACAIDQTKMQCSGDYWCTTTCELWNVSMLAAQRTMPLTCEQFIRTSAFPRGGEVCREDCLLAEIKPNRYPAPTGLGFLCAPGTCDPAVQSRYRDTPKSELGLGILECPCNWFGSDCNNDWVQIEAVVRKEILGDFVIVVFKVDEAGWHAVMRDHRPGGVVRVQRPSSSAWGSRPLEQPYALANDKDTGVVGELEVLTGKPEAGYHETVTEVAHHVRSLSVGPLEAPLYINPSIAGFFNKKYMFLMDALDESVTDVIMIATGAGLSGVRSAIASLLHRPKTRVHLYYGLRDVRQLPYRSLLEGWAASLTFTLLISSAEPLARQATETGIQAAMARGEALKELAAGRAQGAALLPASGKLYVQHALGLDLTEGALKRDGAGLQNSAVVICGRSELLLDTEQILQAACTFPECADLLKTRVFMNI